MKNLKLLTIILCIGMPAVVLTIKSVPLQFVSICTPISDLRVEDPITKKFSPFILAKNLRDKPIFSSDNKQQKSQILFGETLRVLKTEGDWVLVKTYDQRYCKDVDRYCPIDGWINKSLIIEDNAAKKNLIVTSLWAPIYYKTDNGDVKLFVPMGSRLSGQKDTSGNSWIVSLAGINGKIDDCHVQNISQISGSIKILRRDLIERAKLFLGSPYIWGGCSAPIKFYPEQPLPKELAQQVTGVDCSGLVHLLFRSFGLSVPRNSNDQYLFSVKTDKHNKIFSGKDLKPGDLIFFARFNPTLKTTARISHVVIYIGEDENNNSLVLESQGTTPPYGVRIIPTKDFSRLGCKQINELKAEDIYEYYDSHEKKSFKNRIYFGTYFRTSKLAQMRKDFISY